MQRVLRIDRNVTRRDQSVMRTNKINIVCILVIFIVYAMYFFPQNTVKAAEAPTEGSSHDLPDSGSSSSSSNANAGTGTGNTPITIRIENDDDDEDDDDDVSDDEEDIQDTEYYYDEEYDIDEPEPQQPQPQEPQQPQTPTDGSGGNGGGHSLDSTPKTADGDIDPRFVFCLALFLVGLGTVVYSRQKRLTYVVGRHSRDDELD